MSREKSRYRDIPGQSNLGARIRAARGRRSQAWLAVSVKQKQSAISQWERGVRIPSAEHVAELAHALTCDPGWLLTGYERPASQAIHETTIYSRPPEGVDPEAWYAILPLLPMLSSIYAAREIPEHAKRWGWIEGNIQTFFDVVSASAQVKEIQLHEGKKQSAG